MLTRRILAVVTVGLCLSLGLAPVILAQADDHPTAAELYRQGLEKYEAGDLEGAREDFRRVDTMQLPREERIALYKALQQIDQVLGADQADTAAAEAERPEADAPQPEAAAPAAATAADQLAAADEVAAQNPSAAIPLYESIINDADASESIKAMAGARLAHARRHAEADRTAAKLMVDAAQQDLEAGRRDAARRKLQTVRDSGVQLSWFEQNRIEQYLAVLDAQAQTQVVEAPAEQPAASAEAVAEAQPEAERAAEATVAEAVEREPAEAREPAAVAEVEQPAREAIAQAQAQPETSSQASADVLESAKLLYAQQAFAEAQQAEADGQLALAIESYQRAAKLDPDNREYANALSAAQARRNRDLAPADIVEGATALRQLRAEAARAEYQEALNEAERQTAANSFPAALESANQAKSILDRNSQLFSREEYDQLRGRAEAMTSTILNRQREYDRDRLRQQEQEQAAAAEREKRDAERARQKQVNEHLLRARQLQKDMKYEEALDELNQALWLDPNNVPAQAMKDMCEDAAILVRSRHITRQRNLYRARLRNDDAEAATPYTEIIRYPADWPELTETRLMGLEDVSGDSELNRATLRRLAEPVPIEFEANRLSNVIDYLRNTTGVNFFVNWSALEQAGVDPESPISLVLTNVPAEQALRMVLQQVGSEFDPVTYSIIEGIVTISTQRDLQRTTDIRTYDVRDLLVQVPNFSNAPSFDLQDALSNTNSGGGGSGGGRGGGGGGSGSGQGIFGSDTQDDRQEDVPTRAEMIELISTLIQDTVGQPQEWQIYGGDVSSLRELNGQFIIKTTPQNHRDISDLLRSLRETRAVQISVESRFLLVEEHFLEEIGVDFDFRIDDVGGGFGPIGIAQDSVSLAESGLIANDLTKSTPSGGIGGTDTLLLPGFGLPRTGRSLDLSVTYLDDFEANLLVKATQIMERSIALTAPRLTFFNGQRAYVLVARQTSFVSDLEPIPDTLGFDITISVVSSGVVLDVEGTVSADRRYVTLTLRPSLADLISLEARDIAGGFATGGVGGGTSGQVTAFIETPILEITEVRATVSVPDKGTLLLGGQRLIGEAEIEAGVPVLSKIPVLNRLFTNTSEIKDERTLLILVRPTIIIQGEEEERYFPGITANPLDYNANR